MGADRRETGKSSVFSTIFKTLVHTIIHLLTILFCPGVQLLPQVDDFNAKTLLAVRPLQVVNKPRGQERALSRGHNICLYASPPTNRQSEMCPELRHKAVKETDINVNMENRTCSAENDELASAASSSSTSSPFSFDSSQHTFL